MTIETPPEDILAKLRDEPSIKMLQAVEKGFDYLERTCWQTAEDKGWHETDREFPEEISLIHSEISEALEEYRDGHDFRNIYYSYKVPVTDAEGNEHMMVMKTIERFGPDGTPNKVEGIAAELADAFIRIWDAAHGRDVPLLEAILQKMLYNETRPHRHGGKLA